MLAFAPADEVSLSMWLQAHAREPQRFWCNASWHRYYVVDSHFNPDMTTCFGYDPNNGAFFISEDVPKSIRSLVLQIEWHRINRVDHQRHRHALRASLEPMPRSGVRDKLITILIRFYENLALHYEHCEETLESEDVRHALTYLRSQ